MVLFDMVGDCDLRIPLEASSNPDLYGAFAAAADQLNGSPAPFEGRSSAVSDDHDPFLRAGIPAVDLIDFDYGPGPTPGQLLAHAARHARQGLSREPRGGRRARARGDPGPALRRDRRRGYPLGIASPTETHAPTRILLAAPRGYCAGVDRAVQTVEKALELHGPPVYVRKEIVHNKHVVEKLAERGAIFVEQETEVPEGELVVFSAHGVAPSVHENAAARSLRTIDATCPLVTKVHVEARKFAEQGYTIILIGHEGHEEVEGTTGEAPKNIVLVETVADVDALELDDPDHVAFITQTTLSVDETAGIIARLRERFPKITARSPTTSVTRPPTARSPSSSSPASASWCW